MSGTLRMRIFAGPNGSGKSMMYREVRHAQVNDRPVDLGVYINPDDIARQLREHQQFDFSALGLPVNEVKFGRYARRSGLLSVGFPETIFQGDQQWSRGVLRIRRNAHVDRFAQMITQFLCEHLITEKRKFSFETVFSHASKLEIMRAASAAGYKVYLYFIATNDPLINVERVAIRVGEGGHDVPKEKILKRYDLSLAQLPEALQLAYHAFLFDNSKEQAVMFGEMKVVATGRAWYWDAAAIPDWFIRSYLLIDPTAENVDLARRALAARR